MVKFRILALAALLSGALLVSAAPAAHADCVYATVRYEVLDQGEETLWDGCVKDTDYNRAGQVGPLGAGDRDAVYIYFGVWYPLP